MTPPSRLVRRPGRRRRPGPQVDRRLAGPDAALWREPAPDGRLLPHRRNPARRRPCRQLQGKELGYNNIADADAAYELVAEFEAPACVIVKHANPCGVAVGADLSAAYARALECDAVSAFGGVIAVNRP
jgi:hypothetical protein